MIKNLLATTLMLGMFSINCIGQSVIKISTAKPLTAVKDKTAVQPQRINLAANLNGEKCGSGKIHQHLLATDPVYKATQEQNEKDIQKTIADWQSGAKAMPPVYTVPLVFHVIHKGEAVGSGTNISSAQIQSAVDALNRDYRRTSADGGIGQGAGPDTEIQFCLATQDPQGNATTGINRVNGTTVSGYSANGIESFGSGQGASETAIKNLSKWPNTNYVNIWVVSEIDNNGADVSNLNTFTGGILGYAYFPGSPSSVDGIVALNCCVGNDPQQNKGYRIWFATLTNRTLTHEMGHVLDLYHTFEGQSCTESNCNTQGDLCCDTPPHIGNNTSCNTPECSGTQQVENYMDYTDETCQNMFSANQTTRARAALAGPRVSLTTSSNTNCTTCTAPTVTISSTNPSCTSNNGSATATATGGTTPYTYLWSNSATTASITGLGAGTYTVTVTATGGCTATQSVTLVTPGAPTVTTTKVNESAAGACDGSVSSSVSGGSTPYTYLWSNSATTASISGLCAGTYTVTVTGANNCTTTSSATVSSPTPPGCDTISNFDIAQDTAVLYSIPSPNWGYVGGHNSYDDRAKADYFTATAGDSVTSAILYFGKAYAGSVNSSINVSVWNGTGGTPGAVLGTVTIPVSQLSTTQPVPVNFSPAVAVSGNFFCGIEISANGTPQDTVVLLTNQDGETMPGTAWEKWSDNTWHHDSSSSSWGLNIAHTIWVIKCTGGTPNCTGYTASATSTNPSCGNSNGTATATGTGGTTPYTYQWSNNATTASISGLAAGTYTVTVTAANSCTATANVTLTNSGTAPTATATGVNATNGCNGSASVTASGGSTPYTYLWSNGQTTTNISGLCAGTYTVTVTGPNTCTATASTTITAPSSTGCDTISNFDISQDTAVLYSVNSPDWGFVGGHNSYDDRAKADYFTATSGDSVKSAILYFGKAYAGSVSSSINVTVWDGSGGTPGSVLGTVSVPINQLSTTQPVLVSFSPVVIANGDFFCGIELSPNGTPQDTVALLTNQDGETMPGTAWEKWSDNTWHHDSASWGLNIAHTIWVVKCSGNSNPNCSGFTASATSTNPSCGNNNGTATAVGTGGSTPYTYSWSNGQTTSAISGLAAGTYSVTVTGSNSCTATASVTLTTSGAPTVTATNTNASCGNNNGTATATATGGTTPYTYLWSNSATTPSVTGLGAGTYTVTVTGANQCAATASATITSSGTAPTLTATSTNASCGTNNGTASVTATGGTTPYTYMWNNGQTTASISGLGAGTYTVTVTAGNCTATASTTVSGGGNMAAAVSSQNTNCVNTCTGQASVAPSGGTSPYTFVWSNGATTASQTGLCAGSYSVTVTDNAGCTVIKQVNISTNSTMMFASSSTTNATCNNSNGTATVNASGGTSPYTYFWNSTPSQTAQTATGLSAGTYDGIVTDANGCMDTVTVSVNNVGGVNANITSNPTICEGQSATLVASGGMFYVWSTGDTTNPISVSPVNTTTYFVTVSDNFQCTDTASATVTVNSYPTTTVTASDTLVCKGDSVMLIASGGTSYFWNNGATNDTIYVNPMNTTTYIVTAQNGNCVGNAASVKVNVIQPSPTAQASADTTTVFISQGGTVNFSSTGSFGTSYFWSFGDGTTDSTANPTHSYTSAGTKTVILAVTFGGCTDYDTLYINVYNQVGINEPDAGGAISIFPNPNSGEFKVQSKLKVQNIKVYNILGELVYQLPASELRNFNSINLNNCGSGIYYVNITANDKIVTKKITVMRE